jgi:hypothetical protein
LDADMDAGPLTIKITIGWEVVYWPLVLWSRITSSDNLTDIIREF